MINTAGEITGYDYNCGTVVTVPAEIDGIQVKSIAKNAFSDADSFNVWTYSKEESADVTKTYYIFKDQNARALFLESQEITQEELDAMVESDNIYNYLKGDSALNGVDLGTLDGKNFIYKNSNGEVIMDDVGSIPLTELDLSHAEYLESIDLDAAPNLKRLNLNTANALTFKSFGGYGPINYDWGGATAGELEELIINADIFNNTKEAPFSSSSTMPVFSYTHIKKLIILDGKESHVLKETNTDEYGLFWINGPGIETVIIDDGITELASTSLSSQEIKNITLPGTLTTIGERAFDYNQLTSLTIPSSVETIGASAFNNSQITTINFESNSKLKTIGNSAFESNKLTSVTIPSSVETIGASAFNSSQITTINFESNSKLKTIGSFAFESNKLTSVTIPSSVETIEDQAFKQNQITTINFESNSKLKTISSYTFAYNKLTNTGLGKLPSSLTRLDTFAFRNNPDLTQITLTSPKDLPGWPNGETVYGATVTYER